MSQFECPTCNAVVWHQCQPASYWRGRRLRRSFSLRRLRRVQLPEVEDTTVEEIHHKVYHSLEDALGGPALREVDE